MAVPRLYIPRELWARLWQEAFPAIDRDPSVLTVAQGILTGKVAATSCAIHVKSFFNCMNFNGDDLVAVVNRELDHAGETVVGWYAAQVDSTMDSYAIASGYHCAFESALDQIESSILSQSANSGVMPEYIRHLKPGERMADRMVGLVVLPMLQDSTHGPYPTYHSCRLFYPAGKEWARPPVDTTSESRLLSSAGVMHWKPDPENPAVRHALDRMVGKYYSHLKGSYFDGEDGNDVRCLFDEFGDLYRNVDGQKHRDAANKYHDVDRRAGLEDHSLPPRFANGAGAFDCRQQPDTWTRPTAKRNTVLSGLPNCTDGHAREDINLAMQSVEDGVQEEPTKPRGPPQTVLATAPPGIRNVFVISGTAGQFARNVLELNRQDHQHLEATKDRLIASSAAGCSENILNNLKAHLQRRCLPLAHGHQPPTRPAGDMGKAPVGPGYVGNAGVRDDRPEGFDDACRLPRSGLCGRQPDLEGWSPELIKTRADVGEAINDTLSYVDRYSALDASESHYRGILELLSLSSDVLFRHMAAVEERLKLRYEWKRMCAAEGTPHVVRASRATTGLLLSMPPLAHPPPPPASDSDSGAETEDMRGSGR